MTSTMDLWLAWMRGWMAAANSVAETQRAMLRELAPLQRPPFDAAAAAMEQPARQSRSGPGSGRGRGAAGRAGQAAAEELGAAAGYKPSPSRRRRGRPRKRPS